MSERIDDSVKRRETARLAFGPVPSRRLGRSIGINHIPPKACTYSCVYCQLGRTDRMRTERARFYGADEVIRAVEERIRRAEAAGESVDALTFVPDGEPTLDADLGAMIAAVGGLGPRVAVITNASLMGDPDVRADVAAADWVSVKVDAVTEATWRRIDRPAGGLRLDRILEGILRFSEAFEGSLVTETMLVAGRNDGSEDVGTVAAFLSDVKPSVAYISAPTRPPAEASERAPAPATMVRAFDQISRRVERAEYLVAYEGNQFAWSGGAEEELLGTTAVHPMREDAVRVLLRHAGADWSVVQRLIDDELVLELVHEGHRYLVRNLPGRAAHRSGSEAHG